MSREPLPKYKTALYHDDLAIALDWLIEKSFDSAIRFLDQLELTEEQLTRYPQLGSCCQFEKEQIEGIRVIRAAKVADFLLYYQPTEQSLNLIRLVHGSRDRDKLLKNNPARDGE